MIENSRDGTTLKTIALTSDSQNTNFHQNSKQNYSLEVDADKPNFMNKKNEYMSIADIDANSSREDYRFTHNNNNLQNKYS